jgi:chitodextrinase
MKRISLPLSVACILLAPLLPVAASAGSPSWQPNTSYAVGALVVYDGVEYRCIQAHTSQVGWEPANTPALWPPVSGGGVTTLPSHDGGGGGGCAAPWSASQVYTGGMTASENGVDYIANWWTQGQDPAAHSGPAGSGQPWTSRGACSFTVAATDSAGTSPQASPVSVTTGTGAGGGDNAGNLFAPYIDMSLMVGQQLLAIQQQSGIRVFTLAFIVDNGTCQASWGGIGQTIPDDTLPNGTTIASLVGGVRQNGGDVIVSFGGANGTDISSACTSASQVQAMYQSVVDRYDVKMLDFDIEDGSGGNQTAIDLRNHALLGLRAANPGLLISYTLPVLPTGLVDAGVNILNSVKSSGLSLDVVNVMAMDYGAADDNNGQMGLNAVEAASATASQIQQAGLSSTVGVTPMVGVNDTRTEIFQLPDAQMLLDFAKSHSYVSRIAIWSVARDNGSCPGEGFASPICSGIAQNDFAFSGIFEAF